MTIHVPVLSKEVTEALNLKAGAIFLDGTYGGGGHSGEVRKLFGDEVRIIALDQDKSVGGVIHESFRNLDLALAEAKIEKVDAILFDLGISSDQLEVSGRGFSFQRDEPLDMRMSEDNPLTASSILNTWDEESIELILRGFGEEKFSRRIASEIVRRRELKPFETTFDLLEAVQAASPVSAKRFKIHPATRTFQALRIAVNGELQALEEGLEKGFKVLNQGGRFVVISFHSLEDRMVKNFFRDLVQKDEAKAITKKPIVPSEEEIQDNPRSRSAKLRTIEKL